MNFDKIDKELENNFNPPDELNCPYCNAQNFNEDPTEHAIGCVLIKFQSFLHSKLQEAYREGQESERVRIEKIIGEDYVSPLMTRECQMVIAERKRIKTLIVAGL